MILTGQTASETADAGGADTSQEVAARDATGTRGASRLVLAHEDLFLDRFEICRRSLRFMDATAVDASNAYLGIRSLRGDLRMRQMTDLVCMLCPGSS